MSTVTCYDCHCHTRRGGKVVVTRALPWGRVWVDFWIREKKLGLLCELHAPCITVYDDVCLTKLGCMPPSFLHIFQNAGPTCWVCAESWQTRSTQHPSLPLCLTSCLFIFFPPSLYHFFFNFSPTSHFLLYISLLNLSFPSASFYPSLGLGLKNAPLPPLFFLPLSEVIHQPASKHCMWLI